MMEPADGLPIRASPRRELAMTPLRRRMTEDLILRNRTPKTIKAYTGWVADFARYFHASPDRLGPEHVRSYLLHLIQERQASWNIYRQARQALQFFYTVTLGREWVVARIARPKAPKKLPVVLSQDEMARFGGRENHGRAIGSHDRDPRQPASYGNLSIMVHLLRDGRVGHGASLGPSLG
jgi:site-specific recombinase XerD